jgi:putative membrane-bound dehydrogenase-like protein
MTSSKLPTAFVLLPVLFLAGASAAAAQIQPHPRFTPEIEGFVENFKPGGQDFKGQITPLAPEESLKRLHPAEGYVVELVASEPAVRQPIDMRFDDRGRLWVVQYLQYPFPAGLTISAYDQYLRAEYDRVSAPPPHHFRGADKVTILEDKDGDGRFETHKDFVDGLNMATSAVPVHGGVWVLQSPYLLFYADKNGDDIPDGDPEVHLTGFGLEDTHSLASNMHVGPDGWLYGATGSTTNLDIQGIRLLGQGIWRYHPGTKIFEVFAEGGGNTFSFEFDKYGRAYSGTNNGGTRGLHYAQGATYIKGWTKHGPAMNPFIFGFFEHMGHEGYTQRFPQTFIFYEGGTMPKLDGQIVVGMSLTNRVQASRVFKDTSTFRTEDSIPLITSDDRAFRPVDIEDGPDGGIYIADWYDVRLSHLNPKDTWDKTNGRIFRIMPRDFARAAAVDLRKVSTPDLIRYLGHANRWYREHARELLAHRPDPIGPTLLGLLAQNNDAALEALWVLNLRGELDEAQLRKTLGHPHEHVRRWAVRLLGDQNSVNAETQAALVVLARGETAVEVRSQLASSAKRLPTGQAFPIIRELLAHDEDVDDRHIPLLIWWAIESKANTGREEIVALVKDPAIWKTKIFAKYIAERVGMRYTADQGPNQYYVLKQGVYTGWQIDRFPEYLNRNLDLCARLLSAAPSPENSDRIVAGMAEGLVGGEVAGAPKSLKAIVGQLWSSRPHTSDLVTLAARLGQPGAMAEAVAMVKAGKAKPAEQQQLVDLFAATGSPEALPVVGDLLRKEKNEQRRTKLLGAVGGFEQPAAAELIIELYPTLGPRLQIVAQRMLSEKPLWSLAMLQRMNLGTFKPGVLSSSNLAAIRGHRNSQINGLLSSYQKNTTTDPAERMAEQLYEQGKTAFTLNCAACHQENGQGLVGLAPSLVASPFVQQGELAMARIVLQGKENPGRGFVMPPLKHLDDGQIAAAITYVRREFGNQSGMVTPAKVAEIRAATAARQNPWTDPELVSLKK